MILPGEKDGVAWKHRWYARVNVRELCHQLCSIQFRCRDGSCFSQHHRNNIRFNKLYKLLNWCAYEEEQDMMLRTSNEERKLNSSHKENHEQSIQSKRALTNEGIVQIYPETQYPIERNMPLSKTLRLDLYFSNSELTTLSLLNVACLGYICKSDNEYCYLKFTPRPLSHLLNPFRDGDDKKRLTERGANYRLEKKGIRRRALQISR